ncbi:MAG: hypothetical protein HN392_02590 [Anaerolineae bacterium]|jgi:hypothetical protein|nr:hypothetical protein [Anaerolineae bacterium]MBT7075174.1 hypothetical protein [Anaerolineae bacterium]MBT7782963.1 hypothetical protein [Anaerolineae bacterium]
MNEKKIFRTFLLVALLLGAVGNTQNVYAADPPEPTITIIIAEPSITPGENTVVTVSLNDIPAEGYASTELTCTYPVELLTISNTTEQGLFGDDPVVASIGAVNGNMIYAIAGKNDMKATIGGALIKFDITALALGETTITCVAKVSTGDGTLTELAPASASLNIVEPEGFINGIAFASKALTVSLIDSVGTLIATVSPDGDGVFSIAAPPGTYTLSAEASGHLKAENTTVVVITAETTNMESVTLLAGDISGAAGIPDGAIDQLDAMTIGMNYNLSTPEIADLNSDGIINVLDLEIIADNYQATGPLPWALATP